MNNIKIYEISRHYIDYLRLVDDVVRQEKDHDGAKPRKYIGVLLEINSCQYFAPLASPKRKFQRMKNDKDFIKISGGRFGAINFNNMIPVHASALIAYDINKEADESYQNILKSQARFIRKNKDEIIRTAHQLYEIITGNKEEDESERERLKNRCCKYELLEEACKKYQQ